jgi:hypothetical protein
MSGGMSTASPRPAGKIRGRPIPRRAVGGGAPADTRGWGSGGWRISGSCARAGRTGAGGRGTRGSSARRSCARRNSARGSGARGRRIGGGGVGGSAAGLARGGIMRARAIWPAHRCRAPFGGARVPVGCAFCAQLRCAARRAANILGVGPRRMSWIHLDGQVVAGDQVAPGCFVPAYVAAHVTAPAVHSPRPPVPLPCPLTGSFIPSPVRRAKYRQTGRCAPAHCAPARCLPEHSLSQHCLPGYCQREHCAP